jgi:hypothetical protein
MLFMQLAGGHFLLFRTAITIIIWRVDEWFLAVQMSKPPKEGDNIMKGTSKSKVGMFILCVAILWLSAPIAQADASRLGGPIDPESEISAPALISFTGTLYRPGEKVATGINTLTLYLHGKERWILDVREARDISQWTPGLVILHDLFPSTLHIMGPKNLISGLEKPELENEPIIIEGYIHVAYNLLELTTVRNTSQ